MQRRFKGPSPTVPNAETLLDGRLPLHLTASATIPSSSGGNVNAVSLKNPMGRAMEILEIKWQVRFDFGLNTLRPGDATFVLGGALGCRLQLGDMPLTNGYVPVWSFGRSDNLQECVVSSTRAYSEYSWKLPFPLYVPAGGVVLPSFQNRGLLSGDIGVIISYSARDLPQNYSPPPKVAVPYAAAYVSKPFDISAAGTDVSNETDLANPFDEPIVLQRMTGRVPVLSSQTSGFAYEKSGVPVAAEQMNVRIVDSYGRPIIRDYAPMRQAFSALTRSWEMDGQQIVMDPKSFYRAYMKFDAPSNAIISGAAIYASGHIGFTGYREVKS